ncbi:hypothetical protein PJE062_777 [Pseudovibrio sp. JE062]|nr:hypothetical protein PJE062_777 [Pseudovibrio sp. JE062]
MRDVRYNIRDGPVVPVSADPKQVSLQTGSFSPSNKRQI